MNFINDDLSNLIKNINFISKKTALSIQNRNLILKEIAQEIRRRSQKIIDMSHEDYKQAKEKGTEYSLLQRLKLDANKIESWGK